MDAVTEATTTIAATTTEVSRYWPNRPISQASAKFSGWNPPARAAVASCGPNARLENHPDRSQHDESEDHQDQVVRGALEGRDPH
ncbi:MAG: hypothetical protein QM804_01600 [Propionicimonas sp.]